MHPTPMLRNIFQKSEGKPRVSVLMAANISHQFFPLTSLHYRIRWWSGPQEEPVGAAGDHRAWHSQKYQFQCRLWQTTSYYCGGVSSARKASMLFLLLQVWLEIIWYKDRITLMETCTRKIHRLSLLNFLFVLLGCYFHSVFSSKSLTQNKY